MTKKRRTNPLARPLKGDTNVPVPRAPGGRRQMSVIGEAQLMNAYRKLGNEGILKGPLKGKQGTKKKAPVKKRSSTAAKRNR